jgi:hypothetical protein
MFDNRASETDSKRLEPKFLVFLATRFSEMLAIVEPLRIRRHSVSPGY